MLDLWADPFGAPRSPFGHPVEQTKTWNNHKLLLVKVARYELIVLRLYNTNPYTVVLDWKFTASFLENTFVVLTLFLIEFRNKWYLI